MVCYMYKEGSIYYVVCGDPDSFFGPSEVSFKSKNEAEKFMAEYKAKNNIA